MGRWLIVLASALSATTPVFRHLLGEHEGWSSWQIAGARGFFGALVLGCIVRSKMWTVRQALGPTICIVWAFAAGSGLFLYAYEHASAGVVITLVNVSPVWIALYERFFGTGQRQSSLWVAIALGLAGTLLMTKDTDWSKGASVFGIAAAFLDSFVYAMFVIASRRLEQAKMNPFVPAFWGLTLMTALFGWTTLSAHWSDAALAESAGMGILSGATTFSLLIFGMRFSRSATEVSLLLYTEIIFVWVYMVLGFQERVAWFHLAGAGCIIASSLLATLRRNPSSNPS